MCPAVRLSRRRSPVKVYGSTPAREPRQANANKPRANDIRGGGGTAQSSLLLGSPFLRLLHHAGEKLLQKGCRAQHSDNFQLQLIVSEQSCRTLIWRGQSCLFPPALPRSYKRQRDLDRTHLNTAKMVRLSVDTSEGTFHKYFTCLAEKEPIKSVWKGEGPSKKTLGR